MYCFPSFKRNSIKRKQWISQLRREGNKKGSAWKPGTADRVCSDHFVDKIPTVMNPNPTINMEPLLTEKSIVTEFSSLSFNADDLSPILSDHTYSLSLPQLNYCTSCEYKSSLITSYVSECKLLSHKEEFLMTLMRLRLGLLNEDIADRFDISKALCSNIFTTFFRIIAYILGNAIIVWLPSEVIKKNLTETFVKAKHHKCRVILDCFEIFIERPKSLYNQPVTWSDYKHYNTVKVLIGIAPNRYITFISECYGGRASDKFITSDSILVTRA
ncbi:uncharacterized protein LOC136082991 [Hydra vulgaris]|uniref:Uncharacterized protein LOC136082991 n=1 Tax=Hydra vulgaris TaxID=6087 RepID=A0ABM4C9X9_HYDVU